MRLIGKNNLPELMKLSVAELRHWSLNPAEASGKHVDHHSRSEFMLYYLGHTTSPLQDLVSLVK